MSGLCCTGAICGVSGICCIGAICGMTGDMELKAASCGSKGGIVPQNIAETRPMRPSGGGGAPPYGGGDADGSGSRDGAVLSPERLREVTYRPTPTTAAMLTMISVVGEKKPFA